MKLEFIKDLTATQINLLVAKLEGIRVEIHKGHVARRVPFQPDAPANDHDFRHDWMWIFYEPTEDWDLAGEIMRREGICMMFPDATSGEEKYSWTYYPDDNGDDVLCEHAAKTGCESGMRTYVEKYFGKQVDMDNLPKIERIAIFHVESWSKPFEEITDNDVDAIVQSVVEIPAECHDDVKDEATKGIPEDQLLTVTFKGWKTPVVPVHSAN